MKGKILSLLLALALCLGLAAPAFASSGDFVIEDGVLTAYNGPGGDVVIPDGVISIGEYAFSGNIDVTSVIIPDSVTEIGWTAFQNCTNLTTITIPESVTEVSRLAFEGTAWLESRGEFAIVNGILLAYQGDGGAVVIPNGVTKIGRYAFDGCTNLANVTVPNGVTEIGYGAFSDCIGLTKATIPASVTEIVWGAFLHCDSLTDIYYSGSEAQWAAISIDDYNVSLDNAAIHFNSPMPEFPAVNLAYASTQTVLVDGKPVEFQAYALKDAEGNDTNYVKLRDVAYVLNGTAVQFEVGWNGAVNIVTGQPYAANGTEMSTPFSGNRAYAPAAAPTNINGAPAGLDAIVLTDDGGAGYTYYKLRDLGETLGFTVGWSQEKGIFIETK